MQSQTLTSPRRLFGRIWPMPSFVDQRAGPPRHQGNRLHTVPGETPTPETPILGRLGTLEVRLATSAADIRRAQRLRYRVFFEEGAAAANVTTRLMQRDADAFDSICDHLLVVDHAHRTPLGPSVVGTCRLLRQDVADAHNGFYTASEFDIGALVSRHRHLKFLELGRSCVLAPYRNKRTVELLWHGIWAYVVRNRFDVLLGCASLDGIDPYALSLPLSFLHHFAQAPEIWRARAMPERRIDMNRMAKSSIDQRDALRTLPPLIKGYLRLGAFVGDGAVIDHQFGTTDVLIVLPVSTIDARYIAHFGVEAERHAA